MTSSPASRADQRSADSADMLAASELPAEAVTLSDLIADAGPLPVDAALECLQRVAERLECRSPGTACSLGPSNILIDDNGEIWLDPPVPPQKEPAPADHPSRESLDGLGRLLLYLTTADNGHLHGTIDATGSGLPGSVSRLARRLSPSSDGVHYASYAALAADAARLRDSYPADAEESDDADVPEAAESDPEPVRLEAESLDATETAPVGMLVPADMDGNEPVSIARDVEAAAPSGRMAWLVVGLLVLISIGLLFWWIGS